MTETTEQAIIDKFREAQEAAVLEVTDQGLETLASMVRRGNVDVSPNFQRRDRWDTRRQSQLIESFLLNIPVPPVYLAEDLSSIGNYAVIDGKQRLTAVAAFFNNELLLRGLVRFEELNGLRFMDLPRSIQSALAMKSLRVTTLLRQSSNDIKHEVFLRLNTGGEVLNAQEIRNVAYRGPLNDAIYALAENEYLRDQFKIIPPSSPPFKNMADAEIVLRFMTLNSRLEDFTGGLREAMDFIMSDHRFDEQFASEASEQFRLSIGIVEAIWGDDGFKRPGRDQALTGVFDAQMLAAARLTSDQASAAIKNATAVRASMLENFADSEFEESVRRATNTPERLRYRVSRTLDALLLKDKKNGK